MSGPRGLMQILESHVDRIRTAERGFSCQEDSHYAAEIFRSLELHGYVIVKACGLDD